MNSSAQRSERVPELEVGVLERGDVVRRARAVEVAGAQARVLCEIVLDLRLRRATEASARLAWAESH